VIKLFYGLSGQRAHSLEEIAEKLALSRERIRQLRDQSLKKLNQSTKVQIFKNYL
jgi:RNA polymerase primary sigma factor